MHNLTYTFGTPLRDAVIKGTYTQTALGQLFEKKLHQSTGIKALYADINGHTPCRAGYYIFIYTDVQKCSILFDPSQCHVIHGIFYPHGELKQTIEACLQQADRELGLPPVTFPDTSGVTTASIHDYTTEASNLYFSINIKSMEQAARSAFSHVDFTLRFRLCRDLDNFQPYYLIFPNEQTKAQADLKGDTAKIMTFVQDFCRARDPLGIFADFSPVPEVTDKETLKAKGLVMGIMRENPEFDKW